MWIGWPKRSTIETSSATHPNGHKKGRLMNRQTHELALLGILAAFSTMLAWMREDKTFIAVFAAQAAFALSALVRRHFGQRPRR
jgi:hypothetical protein